MVNMLNWHFNKKHVDFDDWYMPITETGCWIWLRAQNSTSGYGRVTINGRRMLAHRYAYELKFGPIPAGMMLCHRCDVSFCINPDHMFVGTRRDNNLDKVKKGRQQRGEDVGTSKLTEAQAREIIAAPRRPRISWDLAAKYGIGRHTVIDLRSKNKPNWWYLK